MNDFTFGVITLVAFGILWLVLGLCVAAFWALYKLTIGKENDCPFCGERETIVDEGGDRVCTFCGNTVKGPSPKYPPRM